MGKSTTCILLIVLSFNFVLGMRKTKGLLTKCFSGECGEESHLVSEPVPRTNAQMHESIEGGVSRQNSGLEEGHSQVLEPEYAPPTLPHISDAVKHELISAYEEGRDRHRQMLEFQLASPRPARRISDVQRNEVISAYRSGMSRQNSGLTSNLEHSQTQAPVQPQADDQATQPLGTPVNIGPMLINLMGT